MAITPWITSADLSDPDSTLAPAAIGLASRVLFSLTGRIYGGEKTCTEVYYPQATATAGLLRQLTLQMAGIGIATRDTYPYQLPVTGDVRIPLRRRPVREIQSLQVVPTGDFIEPDEFWISDSTYLTVTPRVPAMCGLSVEYTYGTNPPADGKAAAIALAEEFILLFSNDNQCRLKNVTSYSRQGVNFEIEDTKTIFSDGRTGVPEVDLFVASVNPTRARLRSKVLSPDAHQAR